MARHGRHPPDRQPRPAAPRDGLRLALDRGRRPGGPLRRWVPRLAGCGSGGWTVKAAAEREAGRLQAGAPGKPARAGRGDASGAPDREAPARSGRGVAPSNGRRAAAMSGTRRFSEDARLPDRCLQPGPGRPPSLSCQRRLPAAQSPDRRRVGAPHVAQATARVGPAGSRSPWQLRGVAPRHRRARNRERGPRCDRGGLAGLEEAAP